MRLGIMQPYFFPYLGYYSLIEFADRWIVFDTVQFIRHGWIERNRILKPGEGWQYIGVPLYKAGRNTLVKDMRIRNNEDWRSKIFRQIEHYKKAPYYQQTTSMIYDALSLETDSIVELNHHILKVTCNYLSVIYNASVLSKMNLEIDPVSDAGDWALNISKAIRVSEYVNPPGGMSIFNLQKFEAAGIKLTFLKNNLTVYSQRRKTFEDGLSIIDVLMFNSPEETLSMINQYELI